MMKLHSGVAYVAFEKILDVAVRRIAHEAPCIGIHSAVTVSERLIQRIVELTLWPFVSQFGRDPEGLSSGSRALICNGIKLRPHEGKVRISFARLLRSIGEFFVHWAYMNLAIIGGALMGRPMTKPAATFLFGVGLESIVHEGNDSRFIRFCKGGPIESLSCASTLIVQSNSRSFMTTDPNWVGYARHPLQYFLLTRSIGALARLDLVIAQLQALVAFVRGLLTLPLVALLARDIAHSFVVAVMDKRKMIEAVVLTNSTYSAQPLWTRSQPLRGFTVHMVWYSQNIKPMVYRSDGLESDLPNYRHLCVDQHWVWTPGFRDYLKKIGISCPIHVIGPMLWYLPESDPKQENAVARVVLFDITPVIDSRAEQIGLIENYYRAENMIRFIEETLEVCLEAQRRSGRRILVFLKHKRAYNSSHDPRYIDLIGRLTAPGGGVTLLPPDTNMYGLLGNATLAIVVPYSSPAYVADAVGTRAVFFDPTGELQPFFEEKQLISFANGRDSLLNILIAEVSSKPIIIHGGSRK